jgi:anti-anti-sigma regulatory factor
VGFAFGLFAVPGQAGTAWVLTFAFCVLPFDLLDPRNKRESMLRITIDKNSRATTLRVEGRLTGPWVDELERAWRAVTIDPANGCVSVDLSDVTFVGDEGKKLLEAMYGEGAKLKASGCVTRRLVEEIGHSFHRTHTKSLTPISE